MNSKKIDITKDKHYEVLKNLVRYSKDGSVRPPYAEGTLFTYITNYNKFNYLVNYATGTTPTDDYEWIKIPDMKKIEGISLGVRINYLNATILILRGLDKNTDELTVYRDELLNEVPSKVDTVYTLKQKENLVSKDDIVGMIKQIKKELSVKTTLFKNGTASNADKNLYQLYVIFKIYEMLPIRNEIANVIVIKSKDYNLLTKEQQDNTNYLVSTPSSIAFYFNNYKTARTYGLRIVEIPKSLKLIIQKWIRIKGDSTPNLFVQKKNNEVLTNNNLTKLLTRASMKYMGKSVSTVLLRKIFYSEKYSEMKKELEHDAGVAGHSPGMALNVYTD
tara:strand:- start:159 stop:1157 length:999 start_codon:yes stop_codon:yes gene_type:complete